MSSPSRVFVPYSLSSIPAASLLSKLRSARLVLPAVSVGNIGQLAIDVLIASYKAVKVGYIDSPHVLPMLCNDATAASDKECKGRITLPVEVFYSAPRHLLLIQQRAPVITVQTQQQHSATTRMCRGLSGPFAAALSEFVSEVEARDVLLLTSASAHHRSDRHIQHDYSTLSQSEGQEGAMTSSDTQPLPLASSSFLHVATTDRHSAALAAAQRLQWMHVTVPSLPPPTSPATPAAASLFPFSPSLPGGGVTRYLVPLLQRRSVPCSVVFCYTVEGDNAREATAMAREVDAFLTEIEREERKGREGRGSIGPAAAAAVEALHVEWRTPLAWRFVFGREPEQQIYL